MIKVFIVIDRAIKDTTWLEIATVFVPVFAVILTNIITICLFRRSMKQQRQDFNQTFDRQNKLLQKQISDNILFQERADNLSEIQDMTLAFVGEIDCLQNDLLGGLKREFEHYADQWVKDHRRFKLIIGKDVDGSDWKVVFVKKMRQLMDISVFLLWLYTENHTANFIEYVRTGDEALLDESWKKLSEEVRNAFLMSCKDETLSNDIVIKYAHRAINRNVNEVLDYAASYTQEERRKIAVGDNRL